MCFLITIARRPAVGGGSIITTSSVLGSRALVGRHNLPYSMGKAALESLTYNTAIEFAKQGIRCNCISPGLIWGPIVYGKIHGDPSMMERVEAARDNILPTGKQGTPWDCAMLAVYLASDESKYVNGQVLQVDGGYGMTTP
eukprot:gnl/TRDRNA2_/TRDRNA2_148854_c0_seq1.p1 gnl/TRDRNA2_/TRDRNA2_148854_c0~~gnl/TRDRNA2_/TRDRNA2_148854_c0_seq1.p1  ORF type:complete len:141 (+),score=11.82 gnl/TRDRNA2_/TRDRNA2_148854_c0_seq1:51-473(+)